MRRQLPGWAALMIIALAAGLLLGFTNELTAEQIAVQEAAKAEAARVTVLGQAESFEALAVAVGAGLDECYRGVSGGETAGYVAQATAKGYGGDIEVVVGVDLNGVVTGISVGGANFKETAGLGAKTKDAAFTDQFAGLAGEAVLKENVDAVTGATRSSRAVVSAVNLCTAYMRELLQEGGA